MTRTESVAEIQGPYGPVSIHERVVHRLWLAGDFPQRGLKTAAGESLDILNRGQWNHREGPDYLDARLRFGERVVTGDVEIHIYERDWIHHGHGSNAMFNNVVLHVVLFRQLPMERRPVHRQDGEEPDCLHLLNYLDQDLEAYAADQAIEALADRHKSDLLDWMLAQEPEQRSERLREYAQARWRQKLAFAHQRLKRMDWRQACHQAALEILGYRRNRVPMSELAQEFNLASMGSESAEALFELKREQWKLAGLRPSNHPRRRLEQYLTLIQTKPDWPEILRRWGEGLNGFFDDGRSTRQIRSAHCFSSMRQALAENVLSGCVGGSRMDTLVIDGFLPLLAAHTGRDLAGWWFHWAGGDIPDRLLKFLQHSQIYTTRQPVCNGFNQGGLELLIREGRY